ncbi:zf-HC2 domain-containing protein [Hydrogenophaga sp. PAMC20947]|uniref:zf-HC2 domain-containing protein n=1 Tax=Hydrogenophaga sp. PAMC20947 TaxID=2565558 RepID=UPI00109E2778|nr:zf-HC2 domain-containing protein [Hydrogenophaga sp. PAMC20947]QCB47203.1 zf-HC2 domain-containing protein [Hydrogenophaga sp. PAMC20947]
MNLLNTVFHSCRRVDELVSQSMDEPLGWLDSLRMDMHLRMCGNCQEVKSQVETLHTLGADLGGDLDEMDGAEADAVFTVPSQPPQR